MKALLSLTLLCSFFVTTAQADLSAFESRFEFVRSDDGQVVTVKSRLIPQGFSLRPYLDHVKELVLTEQAKMLQKHDYELELSELLEEEWIEAIHPEDKSVETVQNIALVRDSLSRLQDVDIEAIFNDPGFQEVVGAYESRLAEAFLQLDPRVLARLDNPVFFYQKTVGHQILRWGLDFAKSRLSSIPILNTASFVLVEVERMVRERRLYHQNMLMHYLELKTPAELGLSEAEVAKIFSSIYESRIPWFNIWDSRAAQADWAKFGLDRFYQNFRMGSNRLRNYRNQYSSLGERHNFAFQEAVVEGERVILNLFDNENLLRAYPAIAYNHDQPQQVARKRALMMLGDLGLSFVPLPQWIKNIGSTYLKSHYEQQRITEGALMAHFEFVRDQEMARGLLRQYFNPFDRIFF